VKRNGPWVSGGFLARLVWSTKWNSLYDQKGSFVPGKDGNHLGLWKHRMHGTRGDAGPAVRGGVTCKRVGNPRLTSTRCLAVLRSRRRYDSNTAEAFSTLKQSIARPATIVFLSFPKLSTIPDNDNLFCSIYGTACRERTAWTGSSPIVEVSSPFQQQRLLATYRPRVGRPIRSRIIPPAAISVAAHQTCDWKLFRCADCRQ
jgi:hypothetical protein